LRLSEQKHKKKGEWTRFGDDILTTWQKLVSTEECENTIINLKGLLHLRDWLAHGRCWKKKFTQPYDPGDIFLVAESLNRNLPRDNFHGSKYLSM
jgi:hypothetical protein